MMIGWFTSCTGKMRVAHEIAQVGARCNVNSTILWEGEVPMGATVAVMPDMAQIIL
jgi:hypothetical protein